jgi:hypothetical protein
MFSHFIWHRAWNKESHSICRHFNSSAVVWFDNTMHNEPLKILICSQFFGKGFPAVTAGRCNRYRPFDQNCVVQIIFSNFVSGLIWTVWSDNQWLRCKTLWNCVIFGQQEILVPVFLDTSFSHTYKKYISFNYFENIYYLIIIFPFFLCVWPNKKSKFF